MVKIRTTKQQNSKINSRTEGDSGVNGEEDLMEWDGVMMCRSDRCGGARS